MFSCECCEIIKNTYFEEHLGTTASCLNIFVDARQYRFKVTNDGRIKIVSKFEIVGVSANNYLFKVNNKNTRKKCEICSKLAINTPERRHCWFSTSKCLLELIKIISNQLLEGLRFRIKKQFRRQVAELIYRKSFPRTHIWKKAKTET